MSLRLITAALGLLASVTIPALATIVTPVPEPTTMLLVGGALAAIVLTVRKRRK